MGVCIVNRQCTHAVREENPMIAHANMDWGVMGSIVTLEFSNQFRVVEADLWYVDLWENNDVSNYLCRPFEIGSQGVDHGGIFFGVDFTEKHGEYLWCKVLWLVIVCWYVDGVRCKLTLMSSRMQTPSMLACGESKANSNDASSRLLLTMSGPDMYQSRWGGVARSSSGMG